MGVLQKLVEMELEDKLTLVQNVLNLCIPEVFKKLKKKIHIIEKAKLEFQRCFALK